MDAANLLNLVFAGATGGSASTGKTGGKNASLFSSMLSNAGSAATGEAGAGKANYNGGLARTLKAAASTGAGASSESGKAGSSGGGAETTGAETEDAAAAVATNPEAAAASAPGYQLLSDEELAERAAAQAGHQETLNTLMGLRWSKTFVRGNTEMGDFRGTAGDPMRLNSFAHKLMNNMAAREAHQAEAAARRALFANVTISPDGAQPNYNGGSPTGGDITVKPPATGDTTPSLLPVPDEQPGVVPVTDPKTGAVIGNPTDRAALPVPGALTEGAAAQFARNIESRFGSRAGRTAPDAVAVKADPSAANAQTAAGAGKSATAQTAAQSAPQSNGESSRTLAQAAAAAAGDADAGKLNLSIRQSATGAASATPGAQLAAAHAAANAQRAGGQSAGANRGAETGAPQTAAASAPSATTPGAVAPVMETAVAAAAMNEKLGDGGQMADPEGDWAMDTMNRAADGARADRSAATQQAQTRPGPHVDAAAVARMAKDIARQANNGSRRFEIRMDPPELGKVEVRLEIGADKKAHAILLAERPETLTDLKQAARALERALADSGLDLQQDSLQFGLRQDNAGGQFGSQRQGGGSNAPAIASADGAAEATARIETPVERSVDAFGFRLAARGGMSVRI
ncbi:flagellar hook-length control protein FliK [Euryhalocaulis caribicus]|uniref:flagellar hook-length control protein FliK n=1 Tax=Euryhalocaulis caribicus TaxID=1161401 RepID=UPI00039F6B79|nr:flagellar hook-length control protein FliK [Euryhalocaulis caribicus]